MIVAPTLLMALREIRRNFMRSVLTTLGVVIGVSAVIAMVTLGQGATAKVTGDIAGLGYNLLIIVPGSARRASQMMNSPPFDMSDVTAINEQVQGAASVAPSAGRGVVAVYGNHNWNTGLTGTSNAYFDVRGWKLASGRRFNETELRGGVPVCVLGSTVRNELFGHQDPIGASIRVGGVSCEVIATLESKGRSTFGDDQDNFVATPITAFQRRVAGNTDVAAIFVTARRGRTTASVQRDLESLFRERRHIPEGQDDDFLVRDMKEISDVVRIVTGVLTALLGAIAGVSLLVGGIGIMNIMLVSVTERTREIGIRLAIGARGRDVLLQFLVEAVVISTFGGIIGIGLGLVGSYIAAHALGLPFIFLPFVTALAFLFSAFVGVLFGFLPARKAARLDPIDALRHE